VEFEVISKHSSLFSSNSTPYKVTNDIKPVCTLKSVVLYVVLRNRLETNRKHIQTQSLHRYVLW
jgi:hypothetical protein